MLKKALLTAIFALSMTNSASAEKFPALSGYVVDEAGILSLEQKNQLTQVLQSAEPHQVVAVTLKSLRGEEIEEYGVALGRHWQIGNRGKDDGVLIILAPNDRQMRIEVGYGLEAILTDLKSSQIIHNIMLPLAKDERYAESLISGSEAVIKLLSGEDIDLNGEPESIDTSYILGTVLGFIFVFFQAIYASVLHFFYDKDYKTDSLKNRKLFWIENVLFPSFVANIFVFVFTFGIFGSFLFYFIVLIPVLAFVNTDNFLRWRRNPAFPYKEPEAGKSGGGFGDGSSGGHTSSGGGFSGHGGSFGGGGSSGRW